MADVKKKDIPVVIQSPPPYSSGDRRSWGGVRKSTVALSAYAAAVTALLLAIAIFGGIMYQRVDSDCKTEENKAPTTPKGRTENHVKEFDQDGKKMKEEVELDYDKEVEVIRLKDSGNATTDGGIVVIDYKRSMTGMYLPETDECYLVGGVDHDLRSPFREPDENERNEEEGDVEGGDVSLTKADEYPVLDPSVLPEYLRPYCEGKGVYWLQRGTAEVGDRQKRALRCRYIICRYVLYCYTYNGRRYCRYIRRCWIITYYTTRSYCPTLRVTG